MLRGYGGAEEHLGSRRLHVERGFVEPGRQGCGSRLCRGRGTAGRGNHVFRQAHFFVLLNEADTVFSMR